MVGRRDFSSSRGAADRPAATGPVGSGRAARLRRLALGCAPLWLGLTLPAIAEAASVREFNGAESAGSEQITANDGDTVRFNDTSTADQANIITNSGGATRFNEDSTAADAILTNNGTGSLSFGDRSTAGSATIVNNGGGALGFSGTASADDAKVTNNGTTVFSGSSTAGGATFVTNASGMLTFADDSTAGTAKLTVNGKMEFTNDSSADRATITNNTTGVVDFLDASTLAGASLNNSGIVNFSGTSRAGIATLTNNATGAIVFSEQASLDAVKLLSNSGQVTFKDTSTAAAGFVANNAGGSILFTETSTAGSSRIGNSGTVAFSGSSSAGSSDLINNLSSAIAFSGNSTAAQSTINNAGRVDFSGLSSAGEARITTGGGGLTRFAGNASGGTAHLLTDKAATVDFSQVTSGIAVGAIEGAGTFRLGGKVLTVGSGNLSTTVDGVIEDGGIGGGTGGSLVKVGTGTLSLGGVSLYTGRTEVRAGTLQAAHDDALAEKSVFTIAAGATLDLAGFKATIGSLAGAGAVTLNAATSQLAVGGDDTSTVFSGMISGEGGLNKFGAGTLALTAHNNYQGTTTITGGTLQVDGSIEDSSVVVGANGTLSGIGTVGATTVAGILSGGNAATPAGTIRIKGDLALEATATLRTTVTANGMSQVAVEGNVDIDGSTLRLAVSAVPLQVGTSYTILSATGAITGTFGNTLSDYAFLDPTLDQTMQMISLTLDRNNTTFASVGETPNQRATGAAVEQLGSGKAVYDAVLPLEVATARAAFDNLSGEIHATALGTLQAQSEQTRATLLNRMRNSGWVEGYTPWLTGYGAQSDFEGDGNAASGSRHSAGIMAGIDRTTEDVRVGIAAGMDKGKISLDARDSSANLQSFILAGYGQWNYDALRVRGGVAMALHELDVERHINVSTLSGTAKSRYDGWTAQAFAELGYVVRFGASEIEPMAGLGCARTDLDGFTEAGAGAADLASSGGSLSGCVTTLGLRASHRFDLDNGLWIKPRVAVAWSHSLSDAAPTLDMAFAGSDKFQIAGVGLARDVATVDAGFDFGVTYGASGFVNYAGRFATGEDSHAVQLGMHISY
ncbi:MAG: autotransporter domain-containing protein [Candidatus Kaistia colombiensis]|nr:MAG: autotransporter domain-containing protein [Kaistia sp.]